MNDHRLTELYSDPENEEAVHEAWEAFLMGVPQTGGDRVRNIIDTSWQRSILAQVDPHGCCGPKPVCDDTLHRLHKVHRELLEASTRAMACARNFLAETGTVMILADAHSTILSFEGDAKTKRQASDIHLLPGANWSERYCGTNAIGTALAIGQPVQIHSAEHFVEGIKSWTCSAAVVRHPLDGEILGVLDVSGLSESYSRQSLALVVTTANRIESRLAALETERRYSLLDHAMTSLVSAATFGTVLFDRRGALVKMNENAHLAVRDAGGDPAWLNTRRIPALMLGEDGIDHQALPDWLHPEWLQAVTLKGKRLGTLLVMPLSNNSTRLVTLPHRTRPPRQSDALTHLVYRHPAMQDLVARARRFAKVQTSVLLLGESGTGKEEFALGLHGDRKGSYVALNCGGLARELLSSELFGYVEGAFTGARRGGMVGKIEAAEGGTLFLDEIAEMPLDMQPLLLRVLEQNEVYRLGDNTPRKVNFRLIAATHRDLRAEITAGRFRMDLYYRIAVASLRIPPLRDRGDDVVLLAQHFLMQFRQSAGQTLEPVLPASVVQCLRAYAWPGNVRELRNVMEAAVLISEGRPIDVSMLPEELQWQSSHRVDQVDCDLAVPALAATPMSASTLQDREAALIQQSIDAAGGNLTQAARDLGIARSTLYAKIKAYGLRRH